MEYIITAKLPDGSQLYLTRRQNREKALLADSITTERHNAYCWSDGEYTSYNLADAETFRAHATATTPGDWEIEAI